MPNVDWGIKAGSVDNFDREAQFKPYLGKGPANGAYLWLVYRLQFSAGTGDKYPQLRIGLELQPQNKAEKRYTGYRLMTFRSVADHTPFTYVPFLDAIGVSENEFRLKTRTDNEGNITRIGNWRNKGDQLVVGVLKDSTYEKNGVTTNTKDIGYIGNPDELDAVDDDEPDDDEFDDDEEFADDEEYDDDADYDDD